MIHLLTDPLPEHIEADGQRFGVLTDFRDWLKFAEMLREKSLTTTEKAGCMIWWVDDPPERITAGFVDALLAFYRADALDMPRDDDQGDEDEAPSRPPTWDWKIDARYVVGDFRRYYSIDLLSIDYMHWWEFRALFSALPDDSTSKQRIYIRGRDLSKIKNKAERQQVAAMQKRIALPWEPDEDAFGEALWESMI